MPKQNGYLIDGYYDQNFSKLLLKHIADNSKVKSKKGTLVASRTSKFRALITKSLTKESHPIKAEQSNTSIIYDKQLILKFYRHCSLGVNPDIEIGRLLSEKNNFLNTPEYIGNLEYRPTHGEVISIGILQRYIPHENDGWQYTLNNLNRFFEKILTMEDIKISDFFLPTLAEYFDAPLQTSENVQTMLGDYTHSAYLLGQRTAEMHITLANGQQDEAFSSEPISTFYQRTVYQSIRGLFGSVLTKIRKTMLTLPKSTQEICTAILQEEKSLDIFLRKIIERKISGMRIRCHGDFHLGQVLFTGKDFIIVDFEGEPARPLSERRIKRSPLRDVAGMMRSFHYAAQTALFGKTSIFRKEDVKNLEIWADFWCRWISAYFLQGYMNKASHYNFLSQNNKENSLLLQAFILEKAIYEIGYELNNRPDWVHIPCRGLIELLQ